MKGVANALLAIGGLFTAVFLFFCWTARFHTFYKDDWDWVAPLLTNVSLKDYAFLPGNEHLIVLPQLVMWVDYQLTGGPGPLMWVVGLASFLLAAMVLLRYQSGRANLPPIASRSLNGATLVLLFFTYQLQVFLSPAMTAIPMVIVIAVGAMISMIEASRRLERGDRAGSWLLVTVILACGAVLCMGQGIGVPFSLLAIVLTFRSRRTTQLAALWIAFLVATAYLYARVTPTHLPSLDAAAVGRQLLFWLALFAGPLSYASGSLGVAVGAVVLIAGLREIFFAARRGRAASDCELLCLGLATFVLATAGLMAMARADFGLVQASQSRYALFTMLYLAATLTLWTIRTSRDGAGAHRQTAVFGVFGACAVLLLPVDVFIGGVWWAKADNARAASLALQVHVPDVEWLRTLHPDPQRPYLLGELKAPHQLDKFKFTESSLGTGGPTGPICRGMLRLEPRDAGTFFRVSGSVDVSRKATLVVFDRSGTVQGVAGPAPVVGVPDPSYGQVIAGVWQTVRGGSRGDPAWFGFVRQGAGPPYRALAVVNGLEVCSTSVGPGSDPPLP